MGSNGPVRNGSMMKWYIRLPYAIAKIALITAKIIASLNDKIICQRNKIPFSSCIIFQRTYANLLTHFQPDSREKYIVIAKIIFLVKCCIFYVQITAKNKDFLTIYPSASWENTL